MYVTVTTPLEVWAIPGPYIHTFPTLFCKVPEVHPCDFIFKLPASVPDTEVALVSLKAEPKLVRLLENSGIKLQRNRRLPPPPAICEEWWEQAEFIKRKCKDQLKYGLGYIPSEFSESEDEEDGDQCVTCHVIHTDNDQYLSDEEVGNIIYQTSHKPRSFAAAANARHGVKNENYLLSQVHRAMNVKEGEVLEAAPAPQQLEDGGQLTVDELTEINIGTEEDPRPTFVSSSLSPEEKENYREFLMEFRDCFAWSYKEMPGLDTRVATHKLAIDPQYQPVKQAPRRCHPELQDDIIAEVSRLITAGFIKEIQYPRWLANIIPVIKKNGQVRVYVDFRDLNRACPKDDFPIPITEMVVDATTGYGALSFMDGSSGYNQIKMDEQDATDTAF